ncbi:MAG TPA: hypothetical protein VNN25_02400 [Thermoanaerobaculia bacterium]|nr:hypothetical protein [Thermoanaerobaculia bacterium]
MPEFLLAHLGIPFLAGLVFLFMTAASDAHPLSLKSCNEVAVDFTVLSIGATGAIFLNPRLVAHWKELTGVYGIVVVLVNLLLASFLVYRRRWRQETPTKMQAYVDLFLGVLALTVTLMAFYAGFTGSVQKT